MSRSKQESNMEPSAADLAKAIEMLIDSGKAILVYHGYPAAAPAAAPAAGTLEEKMQQTVVSLENLIDDIRNDVLIGVSSDATVSLAEGTTEEALLTSAANISEALALLVPEDMELARRHTRIRKQIATTIPTNSKTQENLRRAKAKELMLVALNSQREGWDDRSDQSGYAMDYNFYDETFREYISTSYPPLKEDKGDKPAKDPAPAPVAPAGRGETIALIKLNLKKQTSPLKTAPNNWSNRKIESLVDGAVPLPAGGVFDQNTFVGAILPRLNDLALQNAGRGAADPVLAAAIPITRANIGF
jgi:hypothetical protein